MFSGIVETQAKLLAWSPREGGVRIAVERPQAFTDVKPGDSVATNGVCLTAEPESSSDRLIFTLGQETLRTVPEVFREGSFVNLERSLRMGDRLHGHLVTGHADGWVEVVRSHSEGDSWPFTVLWRGEVPAFLWTKGSVTLNGVSLTVNAVTKVPEGGLIEVLLIPETQARTNLTQVPVGGRLSIEWDWMAKGLFHMMKARSN